MAKSRRPHHDQPRDEPDDQSVPTEPDDVPAADYAKPPDEILAAQEHVPAEAPAKRASGGGAAEQLPDWMAEIVSNCGYLVLDIRDGRWSLIAIGGSKSGVELATFPNRDSGLDWITQHGVKARVPSIPGMEMG